MILPGHLAAGYITTRILLAVKHAGFDPAQTNALLLFGTFAGDFPDIDIAYHMLKYKTISSSNLSIHRTYFTHAPIIWLVLGLIIFFANSSPFYQAIGLLIWLGPWSHFLGDSIEEGVMWLWPLSTRRFAVSSRKESPITQPNSFWSHLFKTYGRKATCYVEIVLVVIAILLFFR